MSPGFSRRSWSKERLPLRLCAHLKSSADPLILRGPFSFPAAVHIRSPPPPPAPPFHIYSADLEEFCPSSAASLVGPGGYERWNNRQELGATNPSARYVHVSLQVRWHISIAVNQLNIPLSLHRANVGQKKHIIRFKSVTRNAADTCFCKKILKMT